MRVVLIDPPAPIGRSFNMPLGLGYMAAVLQKNKIDVEILDCKAEGIGQREFGKAIEKTRGDVFGLFCNTHNRFVCFESAKIIKAKHPDSAVVLLGSGLIRLVWFRHRNLLGK